MATFSSRIPASLQAVFLTSNRGEEVHKPPPDQSAFKVFTRRFIRKRSGGKSVNEPSSDTSKASPRQQLISHLHGSQHANASAELQEPQDVLDSLLFPRNYDTTPHSGLDTAYCRTPTPLQLTSYTVHLKSLVRENHIQAFCEIIDSNLVSNNPCNIFSESLLHMVCRKGHVDQARALLRNGASVQTVDDYGRTPLHDLCWCPKADADVFALATMLLQQDARLFYVKDKRGNVPLDYVKDPINKNAWSNYFVANVDVFWPKLEETQGVPPLCLLPPNSVPVLEPRVANNLELAAVIASGQLDASDFDSDSEDDDEDETANMTTTDNDEDDDDSDDSEASAGESLTDFDDEELLKDMVFRMSALSC
ncbi:hypothetical protein MPSEU_000268800 [Mayamaea pseudoterrestris]|nr:hypothetical protein MPSEU_000268800 [Mayamaea pseudoterrestris]